MYICLLANWLRAIKKKQLDRIGSNKPVKVDIRLIATTNRDLEKEVKAGTFRQDLYFRLNVINLMLPSLHERKSDIPRLANFFIDKYAKQNGVPVKPLSEAALDKLLNHSWPGNIRELENIIHRAVLIARGDQIGPEAIGVGSESSVAMKATQMAQAAQHSAPITPADQLVGKTIAEVERDMIIKTLDKTLGNRTHAANILGISIRTLRNKLKQYGDEGIPVPAASGE